MNLTQQDIENILRIIDDSPYDELRLENNELSVYLKRTAEGWTQQQQTLRQPHMLDNRPALETLQRNVAGAATSDGAYTAQSADEPPPSESGLLDIRSTMVGAFYRAPQPGAAPFVEIGSTVQHSTVIAIVEVMKLMCSIPAGVSGEVREILVEDSQLVEKGQLLMRVRPSAAVNCS